MAARNHLLLSLDTLGKPLLISVQVPDCHQVVEVTTLASPRVVKREGILLSSCSHQITKTISKSVTEHNTRRKHHGVVG